jgi:hypothetical protein
VWDADGGLFAESEDFASVIEHTIATTIDATFMTGLETSVNLIGGQIELNHRWAFGYSLTLGKSQSSEEALTLAVDLSGVESRGVTDYADRPLLPGDKVDRYRFKTFYLEGDSQHFEEFFDKVVDPEWLAGNDEEARALREVQAAQPGKPWRVLHRVTYVERPALAVIGEDARPVAANDPSPEEHTIGAQRISEISQPLTSSDPIGRGRPTRG